MREIIQCLHWGDLASNTEAFSQLRNSVGVSPTSPLEILRFRNTFIRMGVAIYTILDAVKSQPIPRYWHPISAAIFSATLILGAYLASNLAWALTVLLSAASFTLILINKKSSRIAIIAILGSTLIFSLLRLLIIAFTSQSESSTFLIPALNSPSWLGSIQLGGKTDVSAVTSSAQSMATLTTIVIAFCAFSFLVGPQLVVHLIPRRFSTFLETVQISSNVLWRTPNEIRLLNEAQSIYGDRGRLKSIKYVFPSMVKELVSQSTTHAGVVDLRSNAISKHVRYHKFSFQAADSYLIATCITLVVLFSALFRVMGI